MVIGSSLPIQSEFSQKCSIANCGCWDQVPKNRSNFQHNDSLHVEVENNVKKQCKTGRAQNVFNVQHCPNQWLYGLIVTSGSSVFVGNLQTSTESTVPYQHHLCDLGSAWCPRPLLAYLLADINQHRSAQCRSRACEENAATAPRLVTSGSGMARCRVAWLSNGGHGTLRPSDRTRSTTACCALVRDTDGDPTCTESQQHSRWNWWLWDSHLRAPPTA